MICASPRIERPGDRTADHRDAPQSLAVGYADDADAAGYGPVVAVVLRDIGVCDLERRRYDC
jgi:hypothetical protein